MQIYKHPFLSNCDTVLLGRCFLKVRTQWHGFTCQNNWTLIHTAEKASNLARVKFIFTTNSLERLYCADLHLQNPFSLHLHPHILRYSTNVVWLNFLVPFVAYFSVYSRPVLW